MLQKYIANNKRINWETREDKGHVLRDIQWRVESAGRICPIALMLISRHIAPEDGDKIIALFVVVRCCVRRKWQVIPIDSDKTHRLREAFRLG